MNHLVLKSKTHEIVKEKFWLSGLTTAHHQPSGGKLLGLQQ